MQITKRLAIFLENKPGTLARVCDELAAARINIHAITTSDTIDHSVIRMVVSDPRKALLIFEEHGTLVVEDDVLLVEGDNRPGSLARICHQLASAKVNMEYAYGSSDDTQATLFVRVSDIKKGAAILSSKTPKRRA